MNSMHSSYLIGSLELATELIIQKRMQECKPEQISSSHRNCDAYSNKHFFVLINQILKKRQWFCNVYLQSYSWCTLGMARSIFFEHLLLLREQALLCRKWNLQLALGFLCVLGVIISSCWDDPKVCGSLVLSNCTDTTWIAVGTFDTFQIQLHFNQGGNALSPHCAQTTREE